MAEKKTQHDDDDDDDKKCVCCVLCECVADVRNHPFWLRANVVELHGNMGYNVSGHRVS